MAKKQIPDHWHKNTWDEKARENPLYAVMTMPELQDADSQDFSEEHLRLFFEKGRRLADRLVEPVLKEAPADGLVVEYGCGAGRILNALVERRIECAGIDISSTMLEHCLRLVPGVDHLALLREDGTVPLSDGCARLVYSYAVVQHIEKLSVYTKAVSEMCRLLMPGGKLVLQVNCEDFTLADGEHLGRTENFEDYSMHYAPGSEQPIRHNNTTWSGVYIGLDRLQEMLSAAGVVLDAIEPYNEQKPRAIVVYGSKTFS